ncbi:hypothetical protein CEXT_583261 [Caerostris extrusa]|uniref:Uncharacterized protein n=1 Tax=Caerostris extrusa TaxID=172846 RepID=A0AAV4QXG6_CAEEX|nr:hypothetical protein CEXT_583261 [Caerostris extrusa]
MYIKFEPRDHAQPLRHHIQQQLKNNLATRFSVRGPSLNKIPETGLPSGYILNHSLSILRILLSDRLTQSLKSGSCVAHRSCEPVNLLRDQSHFLHSGCHLVGGWELIVLHK